MPAPRSAALLAALRHCAQLLDEMYLLERARRPDFSAVARRFDSEERQRSFAHLVTLTRRYAAAVRSLKRRRALLAAAARLRLAGSALHATEQRFSAQARAAPTGVSAAVDGERPSSDNSNNSPGRALAQQLQHSSELRECRAALSLVRFISDFRCY